VTRDRLLGISERWFRRLESLYPTDFRDEMGNALVEAYMDRARDTLGKRGTLPLAALWLRALVDSLRNGAGERVSPAISWRRAGDWGRDIELVRRRLVRSPMFAASTIGTLAVGLAMFTVVYTAVQKVLIDPMPYPAPGDLYYVWRDYGPIADVQRGALSGPDIVELQKTNAVIEEATGLQAFLGGIFALREGAEPMEIAVTRTSTSFFRLLGVAPALGRGFAPGEIGPGRGQVMVLTHHLWKRLGGDPAIVGTDVRLQGRPFTVIGVLPPDFSFVRNDAAAPPQRVDAYTPFEVDLGRLNPQNGGFAALIRARRGASAAVIAAVIGAIGRVIDERDFNGRGLKLYPVALKADVLSRIRPALTALGGAGLVLVFMLMVNLSSVLLARAAQREHEVAVSRALGANSIAIVRSTLLEGGLLGLAGGALGLLAALWGVRSLIALAPLELPRRDAIAIDWRIAAIVIALGGLLGLLAALAPAIWAARASLSSLLAGSAVRGGGGHSRWRRGMTVAQVALSLVLLSSGGLVMRSFERLLRADPGFRPEGVLTVRMRTPPEFFPKTADAIAFQDRLQNALAAIPGVTGTGAASTLPLTSAAFQSSVFTLPGAPGNTGDGERDKLLADVIAVRPNYVEVMGMHLVAGRAFTEARPNGVNEAIIDTGIARRYFPQGNPLGAIIRNGGALTIVGVVRQARLYDVHADGRPQIFVRAEDFGVRPLFYVMRTTREPHSVLPDVRAAVRRVDARVPVGDARAMEDIVQTSLSPQAIGGTLISVFAIGALLLAAMGLSGVVSGSVTRRRHELAVRLALGAEHPRVLRLLLKEGALLVVAGLAIGAPGIWLANGLIRGLLVGVSPSDPLTLLGAAAGLLVVTMASCYVPARRTLGIDPAQLLREE
jgi:putative ABC transport system permease protein